MKQKPIEATLLLAAFGVLLVCSLVLIGGESGPNRRDCGAEAIETVALQCLNAGVACFVKQDSHLLPGQRGRLSANAWALKEFPR